MSTKRAAGFTLVELVVSIVLVSVGVAGVLSVLDMTTRHSADPLVRKQVLAIAESLLEEVEQAPFTWCDPDDANFDTATGSGGCASQPEIPGSEAGDARPFDNVNDYNGLTLTPISDWTGATPAGLAAYSASISVAPAALNGIGAASGDALMIAVTVSGPANETITLHGYRTRHAPNARP